MIATTSSSSSSTSQPVAIAPAPPSNHVNIIPPCTSSTCTPLSDEASIQMTPVTTTSTTTSTTAPRISLPCTNFVISWTTPTTTSTTPTTQPSTSSDLTIDTSNHSTGESRTIKNASPVLGLVTPPGRDAGGMTSTTTTESNPISTFSYNGTTQMLIPFMNVQQQQPQLQGGDTNSTTLSFRPEGLSLGRNTSFTSCLDSTTLNGGGVSTAPSLPVRTVPVNTIDTTQPSPLIQVPITQGPATAADTAAQVFPPATSIPSTTDPALAAVVAAVTATDTTTLPINNNNNNDNTSLITTCPTRLNKFVRRLHHMLECEQSSNIVEWRKGLLVLHSTDAFAKQILPKYFNTKNFKTFRRQLNYYGFVHVRSFSTTGSNTTALWVNQDLARRGTHHISSVLLLKRVEPCDSVKTAEGRKVRKEEAANMIEDIGITTRSLQIEQIRKMADSGSPCPATTTTAIAAGCAAGCAATSASMDMCVMNGGTRTGIGHVTDSTTATSCSTPQLNSPTTIPNFIDIQQRHHHHLPMSTTTTPTYTNLMASVLTSPSPTTPTTRTTETTSQHLLEQQQQQQKESLMIKETRHGSFPVPTTTTPPNSSEDDAAKLLLLLSQS